MMMQDQSHVVCLGHLGGVGKPLMRLSSGSKMAGSPLRFQLLGAPLRQVLLLCFRPLFYSQGQIYCSQVLACLNDFKSARGFG